MKDRIQRYEIRTEVNVDVIAEVVRSVGGELYEVNRSGLLRAGLSNVQLGDLRKKPGMASIDINLETE